MVGRGVIFSGGLIFSLSLLCTTAHYLNPRSISGNDVRNVLKSDEVGAVAGRFVSVPVKVYKQSFKDTLRLGQCPLVMKNGSIERCEDEFEGEVVQLVKGATTVDVSRIQSTEDILVHGMGGLGVSVGVLGLISAGVKVNVAVDTNTNKNALNLMSSYVVNRGVLTLHQPRVKKLKGDSALFLSEIELGGNEQLLVTLTFQSEEVKTQVDVTITVKILFISISKKLTYIKKAVSSETSCRIQFKSSWREDKDITYSSLAGCIPEVEKIEEMYMNGPQELKEMAFDNELLHNFYHFASWKESPYGSQFNLALINHDLEFLTEQNTEIKAVLQRINKLKDQILPSNVREQMTQLNETLTKKAEKLTSGLDNYHQLKPSDRQQLRDIYGSSKAPQYYQRYLDRIIPPVK